jgi:hypothetical protein
VAPFVFLWANEACSPGKLSLFNWSLFATVALLAGADVAFSGAAGGCASIAETPTAAVIQEAPRSAPRITIVIDMIRLTPLAGWLFGPYCTIKSTSGIDSGAGGSFGRIHAWNQRTLDD